MDENAQDHLIFARDASIRRTDQGAGIFRLLAALAQLVEHRIRNAEVVSSSLTSGTILQPSA